MGQNRSRNIRDRYRRSFRVNLFDPEIWSFLADVGVCFSTASGSDPYSGYDSTPSNALGFRNRSCVLGLPHAARVGDRLPWTCSGSAGTENRIRI